MITIFNFLKNLFNNYINFSDFYSQELSMYISKFDLFTFSILFFILIFLAIRYLIIRYTFIKIIKFFIKRLIISFFFLFFFSNYIYCENPINNNINKLFDTNIKKVCIATIVITGCYLSYKYIPLYYKTVNSHTEYIQYLKKKEIYNLQYKEYENYIEFLNKHKKQVVEYNSNIQIFENVIDHLLKCFHTFINNGKFNCLFKNKQVMAYNMWLNKFQCKINNISGTENELNEKLSQIAKNLNDSNNIIQDLNISDIKFEIKNYNNIEIHNKCFNDLNALIRFFNEKLIPNFSLLTGDIKTLNKMTSNKSIYLDLLNEANILFDNALNSSNLLVSTYNNLKKEKLLIEPVSLITLDFCELKKPIDLDPIDFPLENLEGFRYIGINIGYVVFYPVLYTSNKIFGTCNPLSNKAFIEAVSYLINIIKFF